MQSLLTEVIHTFGDSTKHFHIGGDEFGYDENSNHEFIAYANKLADFMKGNIVFLARHFFLKIN